MRAQAGLMIGGNGAIATAVVQQHAEDAAMLHAVRGRHLRAPNITLQHLRRFDERLRAHLDGLAIAGERGWSFCAAALRNVSPGAVFTAAVRVLDDRHEQRLDRLLAFSEAAAETRRGLTAAFGWVEPGRLQGVVAAALTSPHAFRRLVGVSACSMHRVDPGIVSARLIRDGHPAVRARALRAAGELGLQHLVSALAAFGDEDPDCRFWNAWSAVLLGDRNTALADLTRAGLTPGAHRARAFTLALQASSPGTAHSLLQRLAGDPAHLRWLMLGSGLAGDPQYIPWLIGHMADSQTARLAGEAFTLITGADLGWLNLERQRPPDREPGPSDDPDDPDVAMDAEDGLPWPDHARVQGWWDANGARFEQGRRYFMGAPVTRDRCVEVLGTGSQRQRILAAHYLCLLAPGTPLFNTSAPAWRQQVLLDEMK